MLLESNVFIHCFLIILHNISNWVLEYGALGGIQINGNVNGFRQTVKRQAIEQAFGFIANGLNNFFNGETTERVLSDARELNKDESLRASRGRLYLGTQKLEDDDIQSLFMSNSDFYFKYKKARRLRKMSCIPALSGAALAFIIPLSGLSAERIDGYVVAGCLAPLIGLSGTALMIYKGNKDVKSVANSYNYSNQRKNNWDLSLVCNYGGLGLRLSF